MKEYNLLEEKFEYDKQAATQLAEATTELLQVERRAKYLRDTIKRHKSLTKYLWGTQEGVAIALHDLADDHLQNILNHLDRQSRQPSPQLLAEARSRGLAVTGAVKGLASINEVVSDTVWEDPDDDDEDAF